MPNPPVDQVLRPGIIALAALSLVACGGDEVDDVDPAQASSPATAEAADRATVLSGGSLPAGPVQLVSSTSAGVVASNSSTTCAVSGNGRLALFASDATGLVAGDTNGRSDLFLKNLDTGAIQRVTTQSNGAQIAAGGNCLGTTMTPDGRLVAFNSGVAVFVKNTQTGELTQASPPAGKVPQVTGFFGGVLSDDGCSIVFITRPDLLYLGAYPWVNVIPARLMLRDLDTDSLETLVTDNGIVAQGEVIGSRFAISPDGTRVAFVSSSSGLVAGDANGRPDVFVRDLASGTTALASSTSEGLASNAVQYWNPSFLSNTQVTFGTSGPSSLGAQGLYLKDLDSGALRLLLTAAEGGTGVLSGDGRKVVYQRIYSGFDSRVLVRDLSSGLESLVSASATGTPSNNSATGAVISRDGSTVIFGSNARNLVSPRPPAGVFQIYAKTIVPAGAQ